MRKKLTDPSGTKLARCRPLSGTIPARFSQPLKDVCWVDRGRVLDRFDSVVVHLVHLRKEARATFASRENFHVTKQHSLHEKARWERQHRRF